MASTTRYFLSVCLPLSVSFDIMAAVAGVTDGDVALLGFFGLTWRRPSGGGDGDVAFLGFLGGVTWRGRRPSLSVSVSLRCLAMTWQGPVPPLTGLLTWRALALRHADVGGRPYERNKKRVKERKQRPVTDCTVLLFLVFR